MLCIRKNKQHLTTLDAQSCNKTWWFIPPVLCSCVKVSHGLTVFVVALNVAEEPAEAGARTFIALHPTHSGAHPPSGMVGADLVVLTLLNKDP